MSTGSLSGQDNLRTVAAASDLQREASGNTVLARLEAGTQVTATTVSGSRTEITLEGWVAVGNLRAEERDGFDLVMLRNAPILAEPDSGKLIATGRTGALFHRVAEADGWVRVVRTAWIATGQLSSAEAVSGDSSSGAAGLSSPNPVGRSPVPARGAAALIAGASFSATRGGSMLGQLNGPLPVKVLEQRDGWSRVEVDFWVRDEALGLASAGGLGAAELRANPDKYIGETVEWTIQVLAVQKADELRPEMPLGQPYVLARGPLPESGFVYLIIPASEVDRFKGLDPLARIRVRATVRLGRTRLLPTPVLEFTGWLDQRKPQE